MEKLKDIVLIGFAILGFVSVLSGFTEQQVYGTPESHQWQVTSDGEDSYMYNRVNGEVRILSGYAPTTKNGYVVLKPATK